MTDPDPTAAALQADAERFLRAYELPVSEKDPVSAAQRVCRAFLAGTHLAAPRGAVAEQVGDAERCSKCGHWPHPPGECLNMGSDNDCTCGEGTAPMSAPPATGDDAPIEVHLNTRDCEPMQPATAEALGRAFKLAHEQLSTPATGDDAERLISLWEGATPGPWTTSGPPFWHVLGADGLPIDGRGFPRDIKPIAESRTLAPAVARQAIEARERVRELRDSLGEAEVLLASRDAEIMTLRAEVKRLREENAELSETLAHYAAGRRPSK